MLPQFYFFLSLSCVLPVLTTRLLVLRRHPVAWPVLLVSFVKVSAMLIRRVCVCLDIIARSALPSALSMWLCLASSLTREQV